MISVAIDGPAGAGKSTLAKKAAQELGFIYVDTGALYRAVGLKFSRLGFDRELNCDLEKVLKNTDIDIRFSNNTQQVFLDGENVSADIRTPEASMMASAVSAKAEVRKFLLEMQRKLARENNVLMDGRDIGTVVLPNATVKIYLTASAESRAERRFKELKGKGIKTTLKEVYDDMVQRDYNDMHRTHAPLRQAEDAIVADTTNLNLDDSLKLILNIVKEGLNIQ